MKLLKKDFAGEKLDEKCFAKIHQITECSDMVQFDDCLDDDDDRWISKILLLFFKSIVLISCLVKVLDCDNLIYLC